MQPLQRILTDLIDYAGLFPPSALSMQSVVQNHAAYASGRQGWMLGRVVLPLTRLEEFESRWSAGYGARLSVLLPALDSGDFSAAAKQVVAFNAAESHHTIDAVEVRASDAASVVKSLELPEPAKCFVEVPPDNRDAVIGAIADLNQPSRVFGKIRTGGVKPEMIPSAEYVADFMLACREAGIGFKSTAGLHHPFRGDYPLTYEPNCDSGRMHGFMNVFLGACLVHSNGLTRDEVVDFVDAVEPADLQISSESITWRDHALDSAAIAAARDSFIISFGSCSFTEPIEDLTSLLLLPEAPDATH